MPPKKKKGKKKTKEELEEERRLKEEEDLRIRLEEEKRLEEERKQREEEERKRREEEAKNRAAELVRLEEEYTSAIDALEHKAARLQQELRVRKETNEWNKYLACDSKPDPSIEGDINAFLNSWLLDVNPSGDFATLVESCDAARLVIQDLLFLYTEARALNIPNQLERCAASIKRMVAVTNEKIDANTAHMLQYADEFLDPNGKGEVNISHAAGQIKVGIWVNIVPKGLRNKKIDFTEVNTIVDVPKPVVMQSLAVRLRYLPYDVEWEPTLENIDVPLGGVFTIDLLKIPSAPKRARGWTMRELSTEKTHRLDYPLEGSVATAALAIKVAIHLPTDVIYPSNPRIGYWDANTRMWTDDGITEVLLNEETNMLYLNTMKLSHLAVLQRRNVNFIKRIWSIKMSSVDEIAASAGATCAAQLILRTDMYHRIHFEVTDVGVRLVAPTVAPLQALNTKYLSPQELLKRLAMAGIDLMPDSVDDKRFHFIPKLSILEEKLVAEVLGLACAFEVRSLCGEEGEVSPQWDKWSESPRYAVFSVKEIVWPLMNQSPEEAAALDIGNYIQVLAEFDEETKAQVKFRTNGTTENNPYDTYVHLKQALSTLTTPDAKDRMENSNLIFECNMHKVLSLLRLFSYTQPPKHRVLEVSRKIETPLAQKQMETDLTPASTEENVTNVE